MKSIISLCFTLLLFSCLSTQQIDVSKILTKAEKGDVEAQYNLAKSYEKGEGVRKDFNEALKWYKKGKYLEAPIKSFHS